MAQAAVPMKGTSQIHFGWLGIGVVIVAVAVVAGLLGYLVSDRQMVPNADQALMADVSAAWTGTYDAATLASLYATDAILHDEIAGVTSTGLGQIQEKARSYIEGSGFTVRPTSEAIRQGAFVAQFMEYGASGETLGKGVALLRLADDGKIQEHWVYPAE